MPAGGSTVICSASSGRAPIFDTNARVLNSIGSAERTVSITPSSRLSIVSSGTLASSPIAEKIRAGAGGRRHRAPLLRVPGGELRVGDRAVRGARVAEQDDVAVACAEPALIERHAERPLQIGVAAQPAGTHEVEGLLDRRRLRRDGRRREQRRFRVEQQQVELVAGPQRLQHRVERLKAALELLPLHRQRGVEQRNDGARRGRPPGRVGLRHRRDERRRLEEPRLDATGPRRCLGGIGRTRLWIAIGHDFERVGLRRDRASTRR